MQTSTPLANSELAVVRLMSCGVNVSRSARFAICSNRCATLSRLSWPVSNPTPIFWNKYSHLGSWSSMCAASITFKTSDALTSRSRYVLLLVMEIISPQKSSVRKAQSSDTLIPVVARAKSTALSNLPRAVLPSRIGQMRANSSGWSMRPVFPRLDLGSLRNCRMPS